MKRLGTLGNAVLLSTPARIEAATFPNALARLQGYQDVMREAGLDPINVLIEERLNRDHLS